MAISKTFEFDDLELELPTSEDLAALLLSAPRIERETLSWKRRINGDLEVCFTIANETEQRILPGHLIIEAAPFGAFVPNKPVARVAIGSLDPGERRDVNTTIPARFLDRIASLPAVDPKWKEMYDALVEAAHDHWIGNLNIYFDRRPDEAVERHCAFGLKVPAGSTVGAMFMIGEDCALSVTTSDDAWLPEISAHIGVAAFLKVRTPQAVGSRAKIIAYAARKRDAKTVPVEFEFETVKGWGESLGCIKVK